MASCIAECLFSIWFVCSNLAIIHIFFFFSMTFPASNLKNTLPTGNGYHAIGLTCKIDNRTPVILFFFFTADLICPRTTTVGGKPRGQLLRERSAAGTQEYRSFRHAPSGRHDTGDTGGRRAEGGKQNRSTPLLAAACCLTYLCPLLVRRNPMCAHGFESGQQRFSTRNRGIVGNKEF